MRKRVVIASIAGILITGVCGMAMSDVGKVCLFSAISGVITLDGKPVANAKLVRTADRDGKITDETTTTANGEFKFNALTEHTLAKYLPQEFAASQSIQVEYNGKKYELWTGVKRKPEENVESRGKPLVVKCELNSEINSVTVDRSVYRTLCTWDVEPDPKKVWNKDNLFDSGN